MNGMRTLVVGILLLASLAARAEVIDFVDMIEHGSYGESAWQPLDLTYADFGVRITGTKGGADAFAYLDNNHAGLGVCGAVSNFNVMHPGSGSNLCQPSDDDNVTTDEALHFVFDQNVVIDKIWLNNTHDVDWNIVGPEDFITVDGADYLGPGNGYAPSANNNYNSMTNVNGESSSAGNFLGPFAAAAGHMFTIAFNNQQFYVSGMEVRQVPEPGLLSLLGAGLLGLSFRRRSRGR